MMGFPVLSVKRKYKKMCKLSGPIQYTIYTFHVANTILFVKKSLVLQFIIQGDYVLNKQIFTLIFNIYIYISIRSVGIIYFYILFF